MAKIAEDFPLACPARGGDIRLIAFITDPAPIRKILLHRLGELLAPPPLAPARAIHFPDRRFGDIIDSILDPYGGHTMGQLIVRNLADELIQALRRRAARHGRSAEAEHREILRETLSSEVTRRSFKSFLARMPDAGDDTDFAPHRDMPRKISS